MGLKNDGREAEAVPPVLYPEAEVVEMKNGKGCGFGRSAQDSRYENEFPDEVEVSTAELDLFGRRGAFSSKAARKLEESEAPQQVRRALTARPYGQE